MGRRRAYSRPKMTMMMLIKEPLFCCQRFFEEKEKEDARRRGGEGKSNRERGKKWITRRKKEGKEGRGRRPRIQSLFGQKKVYCCRSFVSCHLFLAHSRGDVGAVYFHIDVILQSHASPLLPLRRRRPLRPRADSDPGAGPWITARGSAFSFM